MSNDATRIRILDASGPIFAEKGFQAATVREICDGAGVNLAAVNYYYGDKERLYIEVVKVARQSRAEQAPLPQWSADTPTEVKLRGFIHTIVTRMVGLEEAPWQVRLMMREVLQPTTACKDLVQDYFRPLITLLLGILDDVLPPKTPEHQRFQIGFSIIGQCLLYRVAGKVVALVVGEDQLREHYSVEQIAEHVTRFSLASLGLRQPLGQAKDLLNHNLETTE